MRCGAVWIAKSVCVVVGSRRWPLACLASTFSSIIIRTLPQGASQSRVVACGDKEAETLNFPDCDLNHGSCCFFELFSFRKFGI